jgi:3-dehydroquinate synthase
MVTQSPSPHSSASHNLQALQVDLGASTYPILIGDDWLGQLPHHLSPLAPDVSHVLIIHDAAVATLAHDGIATSLRQAGIRVDAFALPSGEGTKSVDQLAALWNWLLACRADRRSLVIAVGGGVTGDLAGFAAATYQRGIRLVQVPTTLLAQVDSSVGGKTGINLSAGKNMVGAFWQPIMVAIDSQTLVSLPQREYLSGLAEVVKYGVIDDAPFFQWIEENADNLRDRQPDAIRTAVYRSCQSKARVVGDDERELTGRRAILNYGHTFAHAIEATAGYGTFLHGEAVAIGMQMAGTLAAKRGEFGSDCLRRQLNLLQRLSLPVSWKHADPEAMLQVMMSDKKNEHGKMRLILPSRIGQVRLVADVPAETILTTIRSCQ